jgi:uncharacterized membrane protein
MEPFLREYKTRSVIKAVSWRITGSIDTFVLSYIITGEFSYASAISGTEFLTKIILYYFHERAWNLMIWGKEKNFAGKIVKPHAQI